MSKTTENVPSRLLEKIFTADELNHMKITFNKERMKELKLLLHNIKVVQNKVQNRDRHIFFKFKADELIRTRYPFNEKAIASKKGHGILRLRSDKLIRMRYGLDDGLWHTEDEVGAMLKDPPYSRTSVDNTERMFIYDLRRPSVKRQLRLLVRKAVEDERATAREKQKQAALKFIVALQAGRK